MKKILIFSTAYFPHVGGAEVAIQEIATRLQNEYTFDLLTIRLSRHDACVENIAGVTVYRIGFNLGVFDKLLAPFLGAWKAFRLHRKHQYDTWWCMMATYMSGAAYIARFFLHFFYSKKNIPPIILTLQEGDSEMYLKTKWAGLIHISWKLALHYTQVLTAISTYLLNRATRLGYTGPSLLIPNAVNTKHFSQTYSDAELKDVRNAMQKKEGDIFLVTTSRLVHKNAVDDVIKALPKLPEYVKFIVFGIGPDEGMLKELAEKEGVEGRVQFRGQLGHADMPKYLKACDIFIRPSRSEGMGNSFVEAMAAELPVIATQEGGIADFLFDAKRNPDKETTGWAVDKDSPEQIAQAVKDILENPDTVMLVLKTAKALAFEKYDWDLIAHDMKERVFSKVLDMR